MSSDPLIGTTIDDRYRVDRVVGQGGFGTVYAAWHIALGTPVALKLLTLDASLRAEKRNDLLSSFFDEGRVLTRLKHPNIVSALDLGSVTIDGQATPYLAMEWCEGRTLKALLAERGRLPIAEAYAIVERLADALGHAHTMGVSHRDVKPGNVMMLDRAEETIPQLIDFGIAKLVDPAAGLESTATRGAARRAFTPAFAAPEQVAGGRTGPWTDVHALGLLFITLVTGEKPYGESEDENLAVIDSARPTAERAGIETGAFAAVSARAVAARPQDRYADGHQLRNALRDAAATELGEHVPPSMRRAPATTTMAPRAVEPEAPLAGSTITERATAASRPPRASSEPRAARRLPMALLIAAPLALAVGGTLVYLGRKTAVDAGPIDVGTTEPTAAEIISGSATAAETRVTFCDLPEADKKARIRTTGLRGYGWRQSPSAPQLTSLLDTTGAWLNITGMSLTGPDAKERLSAAKVFLSQSSEALDLLPERGLAYALDGSCFVVVRGRSAEAARVLEALLGPGPIELRGDTFGGGNAIPFTAIPSRKWDGNKAKSLAALTERELLQRVSEAGVEVADAQRAGNSLTISIRKDAARGTVLYYSDPNLAAQLPALLRGASEKEPFFSATEGLVAVVAFGPPVNAELFARIVKGFGAPTIKTTR